MNRTNVSLVDEGAWAKNLERQQRLDERFRAGCIVVYRRNVSIFTRIVIGESSVFNFSIQYCEGCCQ